MTPPRLDLTDPAAVRPWLDDLSGRVDDLAAAASDQTAPIAERQLGRAKARDLIHDAHGTLRDLIALARAGLDPDATPVPTGDDDRPPWEAP
jgi:hypothetical protein